MVRIRKLLIHAFKTVPFYTEKYKEAGFSLIDFEKFQLADLAKLPYLEKEDLRKFGKTTLLSTNKKKGFFYSSSGSTGTPISVYFSKEMHQIWNAAYETRVRNWAGVNHTMSRGMIGGRRVLPNVIGKAPYYRYNAAEKQTYFSAYHISGETTPNYVEGLKRNKVEYLVGCKVFDAYSGVEACGLISENSKNELLFSPDTGIMEIIDITGQQVNPSESGEIIATGLLNHDQPLIRYRIGDRGKVAQDQSTHEFLKVDEIEGRVEDVIINVDGKRMVRFHTLFIEIPNLKAAQIIQKKIDLIQINLIPDTGFDKSNEKLIIKKLQSQLGNVNVEIEYLKSIPKEKNGKFKAVISNL